jgi:hypothetical protein
MANASVAKRNDATATWRERPGVIALGWMAFAT